MFKSAPKIEEEIRERLSRLRMPARGLWHEMRYLIEHKSDGRPGELRENGAPMDVEHIAQLAGYSAAKVPPLLDKLAGAGLLKRLGDGALFAPTLAAIVDARASQARRKADSVKRKAREVLPHTQMGVTSTPGNAPVTRGPPPEVSPFPTPLSSSLPPSVSLSPRAEFGAPAVHPSQIRSRTATATAETLPEAKSDAFAAVSRWAALNPPVGRGYPLNAETGEDRQVYGLVEELAQEPLPIVRAGGSSPRHALIPNAVEMLIGSRTPFKDPRWAFGCIRNKLRDWARDGMEAANQSRGRSDKPRLPAPLTGTVKAKC